MVHHNRRTDARRSRRKPYFRTSLIIAAAFAVLASAQQAAAVPDFDFEFESVAVSGSVSFADDFEDGLRNSPPTSLLVDDADGTTTLEEGGVLVMSTADGSAETVDGNTVLRSDTVVLETMPIINAGSGSTTVTGALSPSFSTSSPARTIRFAGVELASTTGSDRTEVGVFLASRSVTIAWLEVVAGTRSLLGSHTLGRDDVTGDIVVEISLDQALDSAVVRYSPDGGANFVEQGSWDTPPVAGSFDFDQDLFAQWTAFAEVVPEPSSAVLGATSLAVLALLANVRNASRRRAIGR